MSHSRSNSDSSQNDVYQPLLSEDQRQSNNISLQDMEEGNAGNTKPAVTAPKTKPTSRNKFRSADVSRDTNANTNAGEETNNSYCMQLKCITTAFGTCGTGTAEFFYKKAGQLDIHGRHNIGKLAGLILVTIGCVSSAVAIEVFKATNTAIDAANRRRLASGALEAGFTAVNGISDIAHPAKFLGGMVKAAHMASPYVLGLLSNSTQFLNTADSSSGAGGNCTNPAEDSNTWGTETLNFINKVAKSDHQEVSAVSWIVISTGIVALLASVYGIYQCCKPKDNQETVKAKENALELPTTAQKVATWTAFNIGVGMTLQLTTMVLFGTYQGEGYYQDWNDMLNDILAYYACLGIAITSAIYNTSVQTASQYIFHKFIHEVNNYLENTTAAGVRWGYPLAFLPLATPFIISGMIMGTQWLAMKGLTSKRVLELDHELNKMEVETYYGGFAPGERRRLALLGLNFEEYERIYTEHLKTVEEMKLSQRDPHRLDELHTANTGLVNRLTQLLDTRIAPLQEKVAELKENKGYEDPETIASETLLDGYRKERERLLSTNLDMLLIYHNVPGDGNCLFAAVAQASSALNPDDGNQPYTAATLRAAVVNYIADLPADNPIRISALGVFNLDNNAAGIEAYRGHMSQDGTRADRDGGQIPASWGGEPELKAACQIVKRIIRVFREDQQLEVYNTDDLAGAALAPINLLYTGNHFDRFELAEGTTPEDVEQAITNATENGEILTYISAFMLDQLHAVSTVGFHSRTEAQQTAYNTATSRRIMTQAEIGISVAENFGMIRELVLELTQQDVQISEELTAEINQQRNRFDTLVAGLENGTCRPSFLRVDLGNLATNTHRIILELRQLLLNPGLQQGFIGHDEYKDGDNEFGGSHDGRGNDSDPDNDGDDHDNDMSRKDGSEFKAQEKQDPPPPPPPKKQVAKEQVTIGKTKHNLPTTLEDSIRLIDLATNELNQATAAPKQNKFANRQSETLSNAVNRGHAVAKQQAYVVFSKLIINLKNNLVAILASPELRIAYGKLLNLAAQATLGTNNQAESQDVNNAKKLIENHLGMTKKSKPAAREALRAACQQEAIHAEAGNQSEPQLGSSSAMFGGNSAVDHNLGVINEMDSDADAKNRGNLSPSGHAKK